MAFLTQSDYKPNIRDARLLQMLDNDTSILTQVESEAIGIVKQYLFNLYDMALFTQTGSSRNPLAVLWCKRVALYILHGRLPNAMIPPHINDDYKETIEYLKMVSKGDIATDLPLKQVDTDGDGLTDSAETIFKYGMRDARSHSL